MTSGIYEIFNTANGKRYVGQAVNISKRTYEHRRRLAKGEHTNVALQSAYLKYGAACFEYRTIEIVDIDGLTPSAAKERLTTREQFHIDLTANGMGYQLAPSAGSTLGYRFSLEARAKMSAAKRRPEELARVSAQHKGKKVPRETVEKTSASLRGRTLSAEHRKKISEALSREDIRRHLSEIRRNRPVSDETRAKLSAASKRQTREARSKCQLGRKHSQETRLKMSQARYALLDRRRAVAPN